MTTIMKNTTGSMSGESESENDVSSDSEFHSRVNFLTYCI